MPPQLCGQRGAARPQRAHLRVCIARKTRMTPDQQSLWMALTLRIPRSVQAPDCPPLVEWRRCARGVSGPVLVPVGRCRGAAPSLEPRPFAGPAIYRFVILLLALRPRGGRSSSSTRRSAEVLLTLQSRSGRCAWIATAHGGPPLARSRSPTGSRGRSICAPGDRCSMTSAFGRCSPRGSPRRSRGCAPSDSANAQARAKTVTCLLAPRCHLCPGTAPGHGPVRWE